MNPLDDISVLEDANPDTINIDGVFIDVDETIMNDDILTYSVSTDNSNSISVNLDNNSLVVEYSENIHGTFLIFLTGTDQGSEFVVDTVNVYVESVPDSPIIDPIPDQEIQEDNEITVQIVASDVDGDELIYSAIIDEAQNIAHTFVDNYLTLIPSRNWYGTANITIIVSDGFLESSTDFILDVLPVNDLPTINLPENFVFVEDSSLVVNF